MNARSVAPLLLTALLVVTGCTAGRSASGEASSLGPAISPSVSPSGKPAAPLLGRIFITETLSSGEVRFSVTRADGSGQPRPFLPGASFEARAVSPDGSRLSLVAPNDEGVLVGGTVRLDGSGYRLFANPDPRLNLACGIWSPSGRMACEGWDDTDAERNGIYTVDASDGSDPQRLTDQRDVPCDYSPDGGQLAFIRTREDGSYGALMVMDADGGDPRSLIDDVALTGVPCDWAPDGRSILVGRTDGSMSVVSPEGATEPFTGDGIDGFALGPSWSPDGSRVLFSMTLEDERFDVYTAAADGSDLTRITDAPALEEGGPWLP